MMNVKLYHGIMPIVVLEEAKDGDENFFVLDNKTASELLVKQKVAMEVMSDIQKQLYEYIELLALDEEGTA